MSAEWDGVNRRQESWHIKKEITWGQIVTTLVVAASMFWWVADVDKRVEQNTTEIAHAKELMQIEQKHVRGTVDTIEKKVDKVDTKLDWILEKFNGHSK